jgi:hypothetical protein
MFYRTYKNSSVVFYTYDDLLLRLYFEIAKSGEFTKLVISGNASIEQCLEAWELIIKKQQQITGNNQYNAFFRLNKGYLINLNDYTLIRACLILTGINNLFPDYEYIQILKEKGYPIDLSSPESIVNSVNVGLQKCEKLITKATTKRKEIELLIKQSETSEEIGFEQVIANLNYQLGFNIDDNLTLARYNEYQKIIKAKQKATENAHVRNR